MDKWDGTSDARSAGTQRAPDRVDWDECVKQVRLAQDAANGVDSVTLQSVGAVASVSGLTVAEYGDGALHKTVLTLVAVEVASTDGTTPGTDGAWGTKTLYTFPTGTKILQSAHMNLDSLADNPGADGFTATSDFDLGVGSVAVAQASAFSLSGTQSDYAEATVALTSSTSTGDSNTNTTPASHTATPLILNFRTVDDADHGTVAGLLKVSGTIVITWSMVE